MDSEKIYLYVSKDMNSGIILMGKPTLYDAEECVIGIEDAVMFILTPTERGMTPVPSYYPHPFMSSFVKKEALNKSIHYIDEDKYVTYVEEDINPDFLEMYRIEMRKRNGADIIIAPANTNIKIVK